MLESGKRIKVLIAFVAIICFAFGFTTANSEKNVSWLGYLVHGDFATPGENFKIIPLHDGDHTAPPTSQNSSRYSPRW